MRTILLSVSILIFGCGKDDINPGQMIQVAYHLSGVSKSATVGVREPAGEGLTVGVALSNKEGEIYRHTIPADYQVYATYETSEDISDDFRFWITYKGKDIFIRTKDDVTVKDGKNVVAISGILLSEL